ncbi:MAG: hypothetical protein HOC74_10495 [Gemmatimonadetes bacterium]|jgi:hypothetical protein|nr:hypothetical protein [Gemmatimonadota bacterium]
MMKPIFSTSLDDAEGFLVSKLQDLMPLLTARFRGIAAVITDETDQRALDTFREAGALIDRVKADLDSIGSHRRRSIELALEVGGEGHVFRADLDHLLRWIEQDPAELDATLNLIQQADCTVIGRGPGSSAALPERLKATETIVNHVFGLITSYQWDVMMGVRGLSRAAAALIAEESGVDTVGNDVEWPLLCRSRDLSLNYIEAEGLTYKTDEDYALNRDDRLDEVPREWAFRVLIANQQIDAMRSYM